MKNRFIHISILLGICILLLPSQTYAFDFEVPFFRAKQSPTATPVPTQKPSITPSQSTTPSPSGTPSPTLSPSTTQSPSPTTSPTPSSPSPTPTPQTSASTSSDATPTPTPQQTVLSTTDSSNTLQHINIEDVLYIPPAKPLPEDLKGEIHPDKIRVPVGFTYSLGKNLYSNSSLSPTQTRGMVRIAGLCLIIGILCVQSRIDRGIKRIVDRIHRSREERSYA